MSRVKDRDRVLDIVCKVPGLQVTAYAWLLGGGFLKNGQPTGLMECNYGVFQKVLKVQQRIHELVKSGHVVMRTPKYPSYTPGRGVWPTRLSIPCSAQESIAKALEKPVDKNNGDFESLKKLLAG